jgi:hypothetical protein
VSSKVAQLKTKAIKMAIRYTPHVRPTMQQKQQKQHIKTLSTRQKFEFFTSCLDCSEGRCIGIAKTQHRRCRNPVKHFQWDEAMQEVIDLAEDDTIVMGELEQDAVGLARRMSCYLHLAQPGSPVAVLKAIQTYRKTFVIAEPTPSVHYEPYISLEDPVSDEHQQDNQTYSETAEPSRTTNHEQSVYPALKAALDRIGQLEARLEAVVSHQNSPGRGKEAVTDQSTPAAGAAFNRLEDMLNNFEAHFESRFNQLSHALQDKQKRDMRRLSESIQQSPKVPPKKESSVPADRDEVTELLAKLASLLQK